MKLMKRITRLQAKLTGQEWVPPQETVSNSEMIEKLEAETSEVPNIEIQLVDPSPSLDLKSLADELSSGDLNLKKMRKADLLAMAKDMGLSVTAKNTKSQIIAAIEK